MNAPLTFAATRHGEPGHEVDLPVTRMLIGGARCEAESGERIDVEDPATGKVFASVPAGSAADVDRAVARARKAFESAEWSGMRPLDRGRIIEAIARKVEEHAHELALLESYDNGKTYHHALAVDVPSAVDIFRYMAGWASKIGGQVNPFSGDGRQYIPIPFASRSASSARSCRGTIRWRWQHGRSRLRLPPVARSS